MKKRILSLLLSVVLAIGTLPFTVSDAAAADTAANFTNLVIFCRFADEDEEFINTKYAETTVMDIIDNTYNTSQYSVADYFRTVSGGKMKMQTLYLLDKEGASLQLSQSRGYYAKKTDDNPIGFESGGGSLRISELMRDWGAAVNVAIEAGAAPVDAAGKEHSFAELDKNGDGKIDLITVIYKNTEQTNISVDHADPLWDYHYSYTGVSVEDGSQTYTSNHYVQLTCNYADSNGLTLYQDKDNRVILGSHGKICHETTHGLGLLDLYSGTSDANKVGYMSLMSKHNSPIGQFLSAKEREALGWLDGQVETMTGNGSYTLLPADSTTGTVAYKVDLSTGKTLYLEYRQFDRPSNRYDCYKRDITYIASGRLNSGVKYKSGLICYLATTDRTIPSSGDLEVVSAGAQATKTDCAVGLGETLRDKIYSNEKWIDITVTAMDEDSLTFSITGLPEAEEKPLSSIAISGDSSMTIPTQNGSTATLQLTATANYSDTSTADVTKGAVWSLAEEYAGVSVSEGVVTVASNAAAGNVKIQAEYQGKTDTHTIALTAAGSTTEAGVTIAADKNSCTYGYATAAAPTFTATVTGADENANVSYKWYVDNVEQTGETGSGFTFPVGKAAVAYTVKCEATVDGNAVTSEGVTVTVNKATPAPDAAITATVNYGDAVKDSAISGEMKAGGKEVPGAFAWKDVTSYGDAGTKKLSAAFTPTDSANYNSVDVDVDVNVKKVAYTGTVDASGSEKYGATGTIDLSSLIMPGGAAAIDTATDGSSILNSYSFDKNTKRLTFRLNDSANLVGKTAEITLSVSDCANYEDYTITATITVNAKNVPNVTAPQAIKDLTYNGTEQTLISPGSTSNGTMQYSLDNNSWSAALPVGKDAKDYTVYYKVVGEDEGYDYGDANPLNVTMKKANLTITADNKSVMVGAAMPEFTYSVSSLFCDDALTTEPTLRSTAVDTNTIGTYPITVTGGDAGDNYSVAHQSGTLTVSNKQTPNLTLTPAKRTLSGGGTVALTVGGLPDGASCTVTSDTTGITPTGSGNAWSATLPNATATYRFTATFAGNSEYNSAEASCSVSVTQYTAPGNSGGSSSGSTTTTTITQNPNGSTTTTTTDKTTGTVTETTKNTDGSTTVVETKADGTVTETNQTAAGTTATTVTDKNNNSATTVIVSARDAASGETVTLPVNEVKPSGSKEASTISVEVPKNTSVTVEIPVQNVMPGTVVMIVDENGEETVVSTTKMTENGVSVTLNENAAIKIVENSKKFSDIADGDYFNAAVDFASSRGITGGTSATTFGPHESCTRAQFVTFLWRAAGQPEAGSESGMTDVAKDAYYAKAVAWAAKNGIVGGYGNGKFGSDDTITREQVAVILYRFVQNTGVDTAQGDMQLSDFNDADAISAHALPAMQWAANSGIMRGDNENLMPAAECTRAQIVTMLYRLLG